MNRFPHLLRQSALQTFTRQLSTRPMAPSVLLCGIGWDEPSVTWSNEIRTFVKAGLDKAEQEMTSAGYDYKFLPSSATEGVQKLKDELKGKKYDAVIIGFGVRAEPSYTEYFEELCNIVRETPGTKLGFNSGPASTLAAAQRVVPL